MADTERSGSLAKLFYTVLAFDIVPLSARKKIIYGGTATDSDCKTVHLSVFYVGPNSYEFHVSGRAKHIFQLRRPIDKGAIIPMIARYYGLSDIRLDRIFRLTPRDWSQPVASSNVVSLR